MTDRDRPRRTALLGSCLALVSLTACEQVAATEGEPSPVTAPHAAAATLAAAPLAAPSSADTQGRWAELVAFPSGTLTLHGYLYRPAGVGPFPLVVYNHSSERDPGTMESQATFYVSHGYALFAPHRRGQGQSASEGAYIGDIPGTSPALADALFTQSDDVLAAITYASALPYVDAHRVAVVGAWFGGIESLFAAQRAPGIAAAIDFAGAALIWPMNAAVRERMKTAATGATVPVFFLQAENDFDTRATLELSAEMSRAGESVRVHVFPPQGTTQADGHAFCNGGEAPVWGDEVLAFLSDSMRAPTAR